MILTLPQAAKMLSIHPNTLYHLAQRREVPAAKVGNQWRFNQQVLEDWLEREMLTKPRNGKRRR